MELNLHKNSQWAFVDGLLCGALLTIAVMKARKNAKDKKAYEKELLERFPKLPHAMI